MHPLLQSHYSIHKAVAFLGIGVDNLLEVPCDARGKMIPLELERMVEEVKAKVMKIVDLWGIKMPKM